MTPGLLIAAPASGTGKTTVMLGLLAALRERGLVVQPFKNGPDYIDPAFHLAASGRASLNLDTWAMGPEMLAGLASAGGDADLILAEGSMGLFDGVAVPGATGNGAASDLAALMGWPWCWMPPVRRRRRRRSRRGWPGSVPACPWPG